MFCRALSVNCANWMFGSTPSQQWKLGTHYVISKNHSKYNENKANQFWERCQHFLSHSFNKRRKVLNDTHPKLPPVSKSCGLDTLKPNCEVVSMKARPQVTQTRRVWCPVESMNQMGVISLFFRNAKATDSRMEGHLPFSWIHDAIQIAKHQS